MAIGAFEGCMSRNLYLKKRATKKSNSSQKSSKGRSKKVELEFYPHFRYYRKAKHPALIIPERSSDEYNFRKVTHSPKENGRNNDKYFPNPNPLDPEPMYIARRVRHDKN